MKAAREALDHLLIGAPTLAIGIDWLEAKTGVRATPGGSHPGLGTWNALASLGPARYVEVIAPDPSQPGVSTLYVPGLKDLEAPRVVAWAAGVVDLTRRFPGSLGDDLSCEPPRAGARVRPDGKRLAWSLAFPKHRHFDDFGGALPFLIEWETLVHHPGSTAPPGLTLRDLRFAHPETASLKEALAVLGIEGVVKHAATVAIDVELDAPGGRVAL